MQNTEFHRCLGWYQEWTGKDGGPGVMAVWGMRPPDPLMIFPDLATRLPVAEVNSIATGARADAAGAVTSSPERRVNQSEYR